MMYFIVEAAISNKQFRFNQLQPSSDYAGDFLLNVDLLTIVRTCHYGLPIGKYGVAVECLLC